MDLQVIHYSNLTRDQLYHLLYLRIQVFVVEQNCPYQELDDFDLNCFHIFGTINDKIISVGRLIPFLENKKITIGRICVRKSFRNKGYANKMMNQLLYYVDNEFPNLEIELSAQTYLQNFYQSFGFVSKGSPYLEDGIEHVLMKKEFN